MEDNKNCLMISYESLLSDPKVQKAAAPKRGAAVREILLRYFKTYQTVEIDLSSVMTLTPSFAYEAFGYLYDELRDDAVNRLSLKNDTHSLGHRITDAIKRRRMVLTTTARA